MVLFNDTEKKEAKELTRKQKWLRRGLMTLVVLGILFSISLAVMGAIGGPHEALKLGIEDYIKEATGLEAEIGEFDGLYFFPVVRLEASDVRMAGSDGREAVSVGRFEYRAGFWDIFFSRLKARHLKIENLKIQPGVLTPLGLDIQTAALRPDGIEGKSGLVIDGTYGGHDLDLFWELGYEPLAGQAEEGAYNILDDTALLRASLENYEINGTAGLKSGGGLQVNAEKFGTDEQHINASILLKRGLSGYAVEFAMKGGSTELDVDLSIDDDEVTGDIVFGKLTLEDIDDEDSVLAIFTGFAALVGLGQGEEEEAPLSLPAQDVDIAVSAENIYWKDERRGALSFPLTVDNSVLKISHFKGIIKDGKPAGSLTLNTRKTVSVFDMDFELRDLKYGLDNMTGHADLSFDLSAEGETLSGLISNLGGTFAFVGGEGEIDSRAMDLWGGGVLNTMLPNLGGDLRTTMNCFVANFDIENGIATTSPLFLDTGKLTIVGDGTINLADKTIDLSLAPKSKDVALIDMAVPVLVTGDLFAPSIGPSTLGIGKKLGGLLLGTINPAFFALNLASLGLTDDHPCKEYIGEADNAPEKAIVVPPSGTIVPAEITPEPEQSGNAEKPDDFKLQTERSKNQ